MVDCSASIASDFCIDAGADIAERVNVEARSAVDRIESFTAKDRVISSTTVDRVESATSADVVIAGTAEKRILPGVLIGVVTEDRVVS